MTLTRCNLSFQLKRDSASELSVTPKRGSGLQRSRSSGLSSMVKNEPSRVNATWDVPARINRRSRATGLLSNCCHHYSPSKCTKACLIGADDLKSITDKLMTTRFVGTIDPVYHSEYLRGPEETSTAA
ncbi:expressed unknown protein [Seminavis robusta]|uniref:Uncharacterized protein n=1 Tax=Seminavis robusta TaxID=568900 RepID=A0A9N8EFX6_9STRA|nr:expressed unknown protein [Seminavis robusta]|eukprot:Sro877_g214690.1 n/a (128) ;mRNA; r:39115-39498